MTTVLEAPHLRDDYYCSILAYSPTISYLAVGLGEKVFLWSERIGVMHTPEELYARNNLRLSYVTSLTFSSTAAANAILAVARVNGVVGLYSPLDEQQRFIHIDIDHSAVHCSFRPTTVRRTSMHLDYLSSDQEVLMIGDETGLVNIYFIDWPKAKDRDLFGWHGGFQRHAQLAVHTQQICGIAWSDDGQLVATGGNDNLCCLFEFKKVLGSPEKALKMDDAKHVWHLNAAVKAIAFCPWQRGLLAAGGGSNDRAIHFFHTVSGASLAIIDCAAQITSLIWSTTRREIVATFGFAQPEHPYRIAVYAWPSCQQIAAIPWLDDVRALFAVGYPCDQNDVVRRRQQPASSSLNQPLRRRRRPQSGPLLLREDSRSNEPQMNPNDHRPAPSSSLITGEEVIGNRPTAEHGTIVVASSEGTIKFHEIWCGGRNPRIFGTAGSQAGSLGGSDILEGLHGIEKDWEVIR